MTGRLPACQARSIVYPLATSHAATSVTVFGPVMTMVPVPAPAVMAAFNPLAAVVMLSTLGTLVVADLIQRDETVTVDGDALVSVACPLFATG